MSASSNTSQYSGIDVPSVPGIRKVEISEYQGIPMPQNPAEPVEIHVPNVMSLKVRDSDVFLLTYPKSGTHWLWRVLDMLVSGSADYSPRKFEQYFLDLVPTQFLDDMSTGDRRVISLHYPYQFLPTQLKEGRVKIVHLYRNPKSVLVSLLYHLRDHGLLPDATLDKLEEMVHAEKAVYKNPFYYFDTVKEFERDNPNVDIFHLAFEDMKKDSVSWIKKLAAYLNVEASDELCSNIADVVSFKKQKQQEEALSVVAAKFNFYRKGEVDDWKNYLTVAQSERMDKVMADRAASCQFCRHYCPSVTTDQGQGH